MTLKIKVKVTNFKTCSGHLDDKKTFQVFKLKFQMVQKLSPSQGITQNFYVSRSI